MITMGIDASSSCTGICVFDDLNLVYYTKVKPISDNGFRDNACQIIKQIIPIVEKYKPTNVYMEDVPLFTRQKNILKPMIVLGCVQGVFYNELSKLGVNINYISVDYWRQILGFLDGSSESRKREEQKDKAIKFVNNQFNLDLYYVKGKKSVKDDDDIAESICIAWSQINPQYKQKIQEIQNKKDNPKKRGFGSKGR